jgi:hypothetical protein
MSRRLTGRHRYRSTVTGRLVLQLETANTGPHQRADGCYEYIEWRDARVEDLLVVQSTAAGMQIVSVPYAHA